MEKHGLPEKGGRVRSIRGYWILANPMGNMGVTHLTIACSGDPSL